MVLDHDTIETNVISVMEYAWWVTYQCMEAGIEPETYL